MKAIKRNERIRRAYQITDVKHMRNTVDGVRARAWYQITLAEGEPVIVDVPLLGHTESSILLAAVKKLEDRPVRYIA